MRWVRWKGVPWDFIEQTLRLLSAHHVDFLVVGEVCAMLQTAWPSTRTLSLWFRPTDENRHRLVEVLRTLRPRSSGRRRPILITEATLQTGEPLFCEMESGSVLLVAQLPGLVYEQALAQSDELFLSPFVIRVLSFADLEQTAELPPYHPLLDLPWGMRGSYRGPPFRVPGHLFPGHMFRDAGEHASAEDRYGHALRTLGEPVLTPSVQSGLESYRFLWLRTWGKPLCVRIESGPAGKRLVAGRLSGRGGYDLGAVEARHERALSQAEWDAAQQRLERSTLWMTPPPAYEVVDGAVWLLEHARPGLHRGRCENSPAETSELHQAGTLLLNLAGKALVEPQ
jgi:hypothetical protein